MARPDVPLERDPADPPEDVEVRVPATPQAVVTMRAVAADLAARAEFTLDAVADLRMAVDEACSELIPLARPSSRLTCTFVVDEERIMVTATVPTTGPQRLPTDTFGWRVLTTLAEVRMLSASSEPAADTHRLAVRLTVRRLGTLLP